MDQPITAADELKAHGARPVTPGNPVKMHDFDCVVWFRTELQRLAAVAKVCGENADHNCIRGALSDLAGSLTDHASDMSGAIDKLDEEIEERRMAGREWEREE